MREMQEYKSMAATRRWNDSLHSVMALNPPMPPLELPFSNDWAPNDSPVAAVPLRETYSIYGLGSRFSDDYEDLFPLSEDINQSMLFQRNDDCPLGHDRPLGKPSLPVSLLDTLEPELDFDVHPIAISRAMEASHHGPTPIDVAGEVHTKTIPINSPSVENLGPRQMTTFMSNWDTPTATSDCRRPGTPYPFGSSAGVEPALPTSTAGPMLSFDEYVKPLTFSSPPSVPSLLPNSYRLEAPFIPEVAVQLHQEIKTGVSLNHQGKELDPPSAGAVGTWPRVASTPSLRSYTSSQRADLISIVRRFSLSSRGTKCSSTFTSTLEQVNETSQPQAVTLVELYEMRVPVEVPGDFIMSKTDTLKEHEACDSYRTGKQPSYWCPKCSKKTAFNAAVGYIKRRGWKDQYLADIELNARDRFDNTSLHVLAVAGVEHDLQKILSLENTLLNAVNTAGQTFMHILDPTGFTSAGCLPQFLRRLTTKSFDFSKQDYQGSNVLAALLQHPLHHDMIKEIFDALRSVVPSMTSRDNLGRSVQSRLVHLAQCAKSYDTERTSAICQILDEHYQIDPTFYNASAFSHAPLVASGEDINTLENMVSCTIEEPLLEDSYGRNGLHCCAQLCLDRPQSSKQRLRDIWARGPAKARHSGSQTHSSQGNKVIDLYFDKVLDAGVNANSYDKVGNTPLLALLYYNSYSDKHNEATIEKRVTDLIKAGASVHSRDRNGETPLHVAVKRGIITGTRVLIENGANVHARQQDSKGVVQIGLEVADQMRRYKTLHIRIMTCISLVKERGGVDRPTIFQEWEPAIDQNTTQHSTFST